MTISDFHSLYILRSDAWYSTKRAPRITCHASICLILTVAKGGICSRASTQGQTYVTLLEAPYIY